MYFAEEEKIDILINNAGVICHPQQKTVDGNEWNLQVNYLGRYISLKFFSTYIYFDSVSAQAKFTPFELLCPA